jgi:FixJ family two-component response regulator
MDVESCRESAADELVYVVDDDEHVRHSLHGVVTSMGLRTRLFPSAEAFVEQPLPEQPSCLILDLHLGSRQRGLDVQARLGDRQQTLPIVFISEPGDIRGSVRAMKAGAIDVLEKPLDAEALRTSVEHALAVSREWVRAHAERMVIWNRFQQLTRRERQLFWIIVRGGLSNRQMGEEMGAAEKTVKVHRGQITRKMQADSVADLVRMTALLPPEARVDGVVRRKRRIAS